MAATEMPPSRLSSSIPSPRSIRRLREAPPYSPKMRRVHLFALYALAVAQPLLGLLGDNAEFFVSRAVERVRGGGVRAAGRVRPAAGARCRGGAGRSRRRARGPSAAAPSGG